MTPFKALYGFDPPTLINGCSVPSKVEEVNQLVQQRDEVLGELWQNLLKAQDQMKAQLDKHRRMVEFSVGDWVYLKLQPYKLKSLANRPCAKLAARFYGPYQVLSRVGMVAYKLDLPVQAKVHPVFHVSLLKKALKPNQQPQPLPPMLNKEYELEVEPEDIVGWREDNQGQMEVLVKWVQLPTCDNTWKSTAVVQDKFLLFPLEDKMALLEGIDKYQGVRDVIRPLIKHVYVRRNKG
ncbi:hypothetical protein TanjilG_07237 [Lupinus angustifolius]|uniref:Chromo domain-containing protein n=1 Tax=Lupinus angustifolius TaxID=3871 RepID=A0A1J7HN03_LUPAN|nr:hypothetical protein TanjilG_07237 [Lupinus angustifolius]